MARHPTDPDLRLTDGPAALRRALDAARTALAEDPAANPSPATLARAAGLSPRTLQRHCAAVLGLRPQALVQRLRLAAARQTLLNGATETVLDAALRHGFDHPGRFAIAYARAFGEPPSATLRARRAPPPAPARRGTPLLLRDLLPATPAEAARARRATDDLAIALGRLREVSLLAPTAPPAGAARGFRLDGRVERDSVTLSVAHAARGTVLLTLRETLATQRGIAWPDRAARALAAALLAERVEEARRTPRHHADPEILVLRARPAALTQDPGLTRIALDLLGDALHRDPSHARAHALAGFARAVAANHCFTKDPPSERATALDHAARALALAGDDPEVLTLAGGVMSFAGRLEDAERLVTRSLSLDPDQPEAWRRLGILRIFRGEARDAAAIFRRLHRSWPDGNDGNMALIQIGIAAFVLGDYARSARTLFRALEQQPFRAWPHRFLTAAAIHAGATDDARRSLAALRRAFPDLTVTDCARADALHPQAKTRVLDGLARAGLPP